MLPGSGHPEILEEHPYTVASLIEIFTKDRSILLGRSFMCT